MDWTACSWVESVPERMHGIPVLRNSRMPADGVVENYDDGMSAAEIAEEFGLDEAATRGVLAFAGRINHADAA